MPQGQRRSQEEPQSAGLRYSKTQTLLKRPGLWLSRWWRRCSDAMPVELAGNPPSGLLGKSSTGKNPSLKITAKAPQGVGDGEASHGVAPHQQRSAAKPPKEPHRWAAA